MKLKKIFFPVLIILALYSFNSFNNNAFAYYDSKNTISSYPKSMRGTWYTTDNTKIKITKNHILDPESYSNTSLHKYTDAKHHPIIPDVDPSVNSFGNDPHTQNWSYAVYVSDHKLGIHNNPQKTWVKNIPWNDKPLDKDSDYYMNACAYNVSKIDGRKVLTPTLNYGEATVVDHAYKNPHTAKKLRHKKYKGFSYENEAQQYENNEDNSHDPNYVNTHQ